MGPPPSPDVRTRRPLEDVRAPGPDLSSEATKGGLPNLATCAAHAGHMRTASTLPIDEALARAGLSSDHDLHRKGGPDERTMRRLRSGYVVRADAVERLSRALNLTPADALALVRETARIAREQKEGAAS